jgi:ribose transport system substrate-binding protein
MTVVHHPCARPLLAVTAVLAWCTCAVPAAADAVAEAKASVAALAGPQTGWDGPASAPKPEPGRKIVYLSGDEQNDICRLYGVHMGEAGKSLGWEVTVIDGKGSPTGWLDGMNQAIALRPQGIAMCADAASLQGPIAAGAAEGIVFVGLHAAAEPGPHPDLHLFVNINQSPVGIGRAEADYAIAHSNGTARVVVITHNEYAIARTKSEATRDRIAACGGCEVLEYVNFPASDAAARMPALTTGWVQRFGLPLYVTSVGDNDFDFATPALRAGGVDPASAILIGADGNRSAYARIRAGNEYQVVTVSEPFELQAYQAIDEFNRAFHGEAPSGFVQEPFLVTTENVDEEGGDKDTFVPSNDYKDRYLRLWGVAGN